MSFAATWMGPEVVILSEGSQTTTNIGLAKMFVWVFPKDIIVMEKPEQTFVQPSVIQYYLYVESELVHKNRNTVTDVENNIWLPGCK